MKNIILILAIAAFPFGSFANETTSASEAQCSEGFGEWADGQDYYQWADCTRESVVIKKAPPKTCVIDEGFDDKRDDQGRLVWRELSCAKYYDQPKGYGESCSCLFELVWRPGRMK